MAVQWQQQAGFVVGQGLRIVHKTDFLDPQVCAGLHGLGQALTCECFVDVTQPSGWLTGRKMQDAQGGGQGLAGCVQALAQGP
jgi:hypothetical protein